jgi:hypothetical protein
MSRRHRFGAGVLLAVALAAGGVLAGDLTPPGPPGPTMYSLEDIYLALTGDSNVVNTTSGDAVAGEVLNGKKAWVKGLKVIGSMPNVAQTNIVPGTVAQTIPQGYHDGAGEVAGDAGLVAENIKKDVTIFGVTGTLYNAALPKTGQTQSRRTGDDGDLQKGVAWPSPRFTDHGNGTVTDNLTGLMWVKAPHSLVGNSGSMTWANAIDFCNGLTHAEQSDWRLPNVRELLSLICYQHDFPALPWGHPFTIRIDSYWSSTAIAATTDRAWIMETQKGYTIYGDKTLSKYVWPVRSGQ